jgi:hypothetical protein
MTKHTLSIEERIEKERVLSLQNLNSKCEYNDVCRDCEIRCSFERKWDCGYWRNWKSVDLNNVFKEKVDDNGNYFLDL